MYEINDTFCVCGTYSFRFSLLYLIVQIGDKFTLTVMFKKVSCFKSCIIKKSQTNTQLFSCPVLSRKGDGGTYSFLLLLKSNKKIFCLVLYTKVHIRDVFSTYLPTFAKFVRNNKSPLNIQVLIEQLLFHEIN